MSKEIAEITKFFDIESLDSLLDLPPRFKPSRWVIPVLIAGLSLSLLGADDLVITPLILFVLPFQMTLNTLRKNPLDFNRYLVYWVFFCVCKTSDTLMEYLLCGWFWLMTKVALMVLILHHKSNAYQTLISLIPPTSLDFLG